MYRDRHSHHSRRGVQPKTPGESRDMAFARRTVHRDLILQNGVAIGPSPVSVRVSKDLDHLKLDGYGAHPVPGEDEAENALVASDGTVMLAWTCPFCELHNEAWRQTCDGCYATRTADGSVHLSPDVAAALSPKAAAATADEGAFPKLARPPRAAPPPAKWACDMCTLENAGTRRQCEACLAPRPTAGATATTPTATSADTSAPPPTAMIPGSTAAATSTTATTRVDASAAAPTAAAAAAPPLSATGDIVEDDDWERVGGGDNADGSSDEWEEVAGPLAGSDGVVESSPPPPPPAAAAAALATSTAVPTGSPPTAPPAGERDDGDEDDDDDEWEVVGEACDGAEDALEDASGGAAIVSDVVEGTPVDLAAYEAALEEKRKQLSRYMTDVMAGVRARVWDVKPDGALVSDFAGTETPTPSGSWPLSVAVPSMMQGPTTPALRELPNPTRWGCSEGRVMETLDKFNIRVYSIENVLRPDLVQAFEWKMHVTRSLLRSAEPRIAFHGTAVDRVGSIVRQGLLAPGTKGVTMVNGASYGPGIYLSPSPAFASGYARSGANASGRTLLVCAVIVGSTNNVYYVRKKPSRRKQRGARRQGLVAPKGAPPSSKRIQPGSQAAVSVLPNEQIIVCKDASQVLPIFVVKLADWNAPYLQRDAGGRYTLVNPAHGSTEVAPVDRFVGIGQAGEFQAYRRMPAEA